MPFFRSHMTSQAAPQGAGSKSMQQSLTPGVRSLSDKAALNIAITEHGHGGLPEALAHLLPVLGVNQPTQVFSFLNGKNLQGNNALAESHS